MNCVMMKKKIEMSYAIQTGKKITLKLLGQVIIIDKRIKIVKRNLYKVKKIITSI